MDNRIFNQYLKVPIYNFCRIPVKALYYKKVFFSKDTDGGFMKSIRLKLIIANAGGIVFSIQIIAAPDIKIQQTRILSETGVALNDVSAKMKESINAIGEQIDMFKV
jgi:hypothetical protein